MAMPRVEDDACALYALGASLEVTCAAGADPGLRCAEAGERAGEALSSDVASGGERFSGHDGTSLATRLPDGLKAFSVISSGPSQAGDGQTPEERLYDSEERFRAAFETSEDAISISRMRDGLYVDVNAAFARLFGFTKREVIGRTALDLGIWPDKATRDSFISGLIGQPRIRDRVLQLRRMDGSQRTMMVSATRCVLAGEPHLLASLRDVTDAQQTEMELRKLWQAVEQSSVAVLITNADGCIEYVNPCFTEITGYSHDEAVGRNPSILKSGLTPESDYRRLWETISRGSAWQGEFCNRRKDGSLFWGVASVSPLLDAQGRVTHFVGIQADITERKRAEQELRASEERFRSLVDTSLLGICIEADGKPLFVNQTFAEIFGYRDAAEVLALGSLNTLYISGEARPATRCHAASSADRPASHREIRGVRKDGSVVWLQAQSRIVPWNDSTAVQTAVLDITLRKQFEDRLQYQANFDPVTGLPNRNLALDRLISAIEAARRRATRVSVLFIDVDRFKKINDTLGHAAGDRFLRQVAQRLKASVRQMDTVARLGGDEFVVLLNDVRLRSDAEAVAAKIAEMNAEPFMLDGQEAFVTLSIGIASFPEDGDDAQELLRHADAAMYVAKENGRSQVRLFSPELRQRSHNRVRMEADLRHAIERQQLVLHYQPLLDIRTGAVVGAEGLLRWFHPEHGNISPDHFVRLAEETGLIVSIGEWALDSGCREIRRWIRAGHEGLRLSINVSGRQFRESSFATAVERALRDYRLDPGCLELEITERLLLDDAADVAVSIDRLIKDGVRLAIDDFGTGYSSLGYLNRFPLDTLKIDRSFIVGLPTDTGQSTLIDGLIMLAHRLHLKVVAEGVENAGQLEFLRNRDCDLAQGYFFSPPLPGDDLLKLLDRQNHRFAGVS
jgi:diguanylate cyclase (GGDEF)-like protein/PAS domain S-box-containing protein